MRPGSPPLLEVDVSPVSDDAQARLWAAVAEIASTQPNLSLRPDEKRNAAILGGPTPSVLQATIAGIALETGVELEVGEARAAWREQLLGETRVDYTYKRQTGGSGEFARVILAIMPAALDNTVVFRRAYPVAASRPSLYLRLKPA